MNWRDPVSHHDGGSRLRVVETFTGTRVGVLEGDGDGAPYKLVVHYFDEHGKRIAVDDPALTAIDPETP